MEFCLINPTSGCAAIRLKPKAKASTHGTAPKYRSQKPAEPHSKPNRRTAERSARSGTQ